MLVALVDVLRKSIIMFADLEGTISDGYGVVADVANPAKRGSYVVALACGQVPHAMFSFLPI